MQTSIIRYSDTISAGRIDAEFLNRRKILDEILINTPFKLMDNIAVVTDGEHASPIYQEDGYICLTGKNIKDFMIDTESAYRVVKEQFIKNQRVLLNKGNILLGIVGTIGNCAVVMENIEGITTRHVATIKELKNEVSPHYIVTFLSCKYGLEQSLLYSAGNVQPLINLGNIKKFKIPLFSESFQKRIEGMVLEAHAERERADKLTKEANALLEIELGIKDWTPPKDKLNISVRSYSKTKSANRIDAEYYQPKYDAILEKITSYKGGWSIIGEEFITNKDSFKIDNSTMYNYVEIGSINTGSGEIDSTSLLGIDLPANCKRVLYKDDILISKVRPYRGAISIVNNSNYVGSGAFTVLQEKQPSTINKETLYSFLRLPIMLEYSLKSSTGTSYPTIIDEDIYNTKIPLIDKKIQEQIASKISEAHLSRQKAKSLLENAKTTVEHAIEHGE